MKEQKSEKPQEEQLASNDVELEARGKEFIEAWHKVLDDLDADTWQRLLLEKCEQACYWRLVAYMRANSERLVSNHETYSEKCVSGEELQGYMGPLEQDRYSQQWLDMHNVPTQELAMQEYLRYSDEIKIIVGYNARETPISRIVRNFSLSYHEFKILSTLVMAFSVEPIMRLMTVAWADYSVRIPTVAFLCQLLASSEEEYAELLNCLRENATLRRMRLVIGEKHANYPNYTPTLFTPLSLEQTVIDAFRGLGSNASQSLGNRIFHTDAKPMSQLFVHEQSRQEFDYALQLASPRICLWGPEHSGRRSLVCSAAIHQRKISVLEVDLVLELSRVAEDMLPTRLAEIMRDALIGNSALLMSLDGLGQGEDGKRLSNILEKNASRLEPLYQSYPGSIFFVAKQYESYFKRALGNPQSIELRYPRAVDAYVLWKSALSFIESAEKVEKMAKLFSQNYLLPAAKIFSIADTVMQKHDAENAIPIDTHHVLSEIQSSFEHNLGELADVSVSKVELSGVILDEEAEVEVKKILAYASNLHTVLDNWGFIERSPYGNALSALFSGPPGTGKTLLATALANELGKVLYRVDLSKIVDKYIGETEKNLAKIFDEAAKAQAIILFDEADALFAARTDVKSSNDRYANLEINFLLQKLESYDGMTILTTNLSKGIDDAFRRRMRFIIDFPMPDVKGRMQLWQRMMPPRAPVADDISWEWLAETFEMSGGYIRNAVLKAAIVAADEAAPINMKHLADAAQQEARSLGMLLRLDDDFDSYHY
ncbi:MAG: ATP-binding protein [Bradymonadales bacterium]|jgi:AAA+ superfamily predicted ATPase